MKNKKKGFSLIEVIMALAILTIAILPILSMYPSALKMTNKATTNEEWSRVTMSILDYVKANGYNGLSGNTTLFASAGVTEFNRTYDFVPVTPGSVSNFKSSTFESNFFGVSNLFYISTKGLKLNDYQFRIYLKREKPTDTSGAELYSKLDTVNGKIGTSATPFIYGIIRIREKAGTPNWNTEMPRDMKFMMTPIENWRN